MDFKYGISLVGWNPLLVANVDHLGGVATANTVLQQRDTGDAVAMLQSMGESTFDSSQLVLSACLGFQVIQEKLLQELRIQHRPAVLAALHERSMELHLWRTANGIGSKHTNGVVTPVKTSLIITENGTLRRSRDSALQGSETEDLEEDEETESIDLQEQVIKTVPKMVAFYWLPVGSHREFCRLFLLRVHIMYGGFELGFEIKETSEWSDPIGQEENSGPKEFTLGSRFDI